MLGVYAMLTRVAAAGRESPAVVVHGPPGAGKSALATRLANELGVPCFDRDEFKDLLFDELGYSDREWSRRVGVASWGLLTVVTCRLIANGVGFVAESNFVPGAPTVSAIREAAAAAQRRVHGVYVTADAEVLWQRFDRRWRNGGRHPGHIGFSDHDEFSRAIGARDHGPIDFGGPMRTIDTTENWPDVAALATGIHNSLGR